MNQRLRFLFFFLSILLILAACQGNRPATPTPTAPSTGSGQANTHRTETIETDEPKPTAQPTAVPDHLAWEPLGDFALDDFPPDAPLVLQFNQPMETTAPQPLLFSPPVRGEFEWSDNNTVLTFTPDDGFSTNRSYWVNLHASVKSRSGLEFASVQRWQIRTQNTPQISRRTPSGTTVAERQPSFALMFNREMDRASVEDAIAISPAIDYTLAWDDNTLNLIVEEQLTFGTEYEFSIGKTAVDQTNRHLARP